MSDFGARVLPVEKAAEYVGLSKSTFLSEVAPVVRPIRLTERRVGWDRLLLDRWVDMKQGLMPVEAARERVNPLSMLP